MGMDPMGGGASPMPMGDPNAMGADPNMMGDDPMAGGDPNAMGGDPNMMDGDPNAPVMGANPFGDEGNADVSGDPEKKAESLAGQLASIFRNDLKNDGINTHEDKKKEVLGMIASAIVDGMNDEDRNSMIEYLSDKLNGSGESDGDDDNGDNDSQDDMNGDQDMQNQDPMMGGDPNAMGGDPNAMGGDPSMQQMMEAKVNEVVEGVLKELRMDNLGKTKKTSIKSRVDDKSDGYKSKPYKR